jgi:hypothetical protein
MSALTKARYWSVSSEAEHSPHPHTLFLWDPFLGLVFPSTTLHPRFSDWRPSDFPWFHFPENMRWSVYILRLFIKQLLTLLLFPAHYIPIFCSAPCSPKSRDSSVGIATGYGLDDRIGFRFPAGAGNFSLHHRVQTDSGTHPASYPMGNEVSFPGSKAAGEWSWPLTSN